MNATSPAPYGIERIQVYPGSMVLDIGALCAARGTSHESVRAALMTDQRSLVPPWEDTVTLAVNAADGLLSEEELATVELLVVSTESSVDQEKPVSSWVHRWLGLPRHCRNFEVKHACYGATGAMRLALSWLREQGDRPCRALVVCADASLLGFGEPYEPVMGACGAAIVLSNRPELLEIEPTGAGVYASEVTDVIRPALGVETGNSETSLFAYLEALEGAWIDFARRAPRPPSFDADFARHIYHLPFAGMGLQAHRTLASIAMGLDRRSATEHYRARVEPSLRYSRRIGSSYSASTFIALLSLLDHCADVSPGDRVSVFAYGSGSCAEFYAARVGARAHEVARGACLRERLDARRPLTVAEYEASERARVGAMGAESYSPDSSVVAGHFADRYAGSGALVLECVRGYERHYARA